MKWWLPKGQNSLKKFAAICSQVLAHFWSVLPNRFNLYLGKVLAFLWIDVLRVRRQVIFSNLDLAFPNMDQKLKQKIARSCMQNMCRSFFDVIKIPSLSDAWIKSHVIVEGLEKLTLAQAENKGILFLSLHLGSGDLAAAIISRDILPSYLITKRFKSTFLDAFWFALRGASKTQFIDAHAKKNAFDILAALKKRHGVVFVLDQFMGMPYGVESYFFGHKTGTAYGLALFAKKTQAPVICIHTYWDSNDKLHICFGQRIDLSAFSSDDDECYKRNATNRFNTELENVIRRHPEHWMWLHRRWKTFE